jgi:hypothetical protein
MSIFMRRGLVRTIVATFVVVAKYSPTSTGLSATKPSIGAAITV